MDQRWIDLDGMHNVRDLGGLPLRDGVMPRRVVLRGETVFHLSERGLDDLLGQGVERVLDLREPAEAAEDGMGPLTDLYRSGEVAHERVPLVGLPSIAEDPVGHVRHAHVVADSYARYLQHGGFHLTAALSRFAWSQSAMYVHCAVGKDRTGVVCALLLKLAGATDDTVVEDYVATAQRLTPVITRLAERPAYQHLVDPDWIAQQPSADAMRLFLADLGARGGASRWLLDHGMDPDTRDLLELRLRTSARDIAAAS
jgi:protein-tyrosine phosphatase